MQDVYANGCTVNGTVLLLNNCVFEYNSAKMTGGAIVAVNVSLFAGNTNFTGNTASLNGAAIHVDRETNLLAENCLFKDDSKSANNDVLTAQTFKFAG